MAQKLQKMSVWLVVLLTIVTLGIYMPIWFINRKDAFNNLKSKEKIGTGPFIVALILFGISAIMTVLSMLFLGTLTVEMIDVIGSVLSFLGTIIIIAMSFKVSKILNDSYKSNLSKSTLSVIAIVFFTIVYLQYKINKFLETSHAKK